jgi:signal peptidase II
VTEPALEPPRAPDVRVGSTAHDIGHISAVERPLGATPGQWAGLAAIAGAAFAADQVTKQVVTAELALGEEVDVVGPFTLHHVRNSGIAFGLFSSATPVVILLTAAAVTWMLWFFWRSGSRHPILPVSLGFVIGGSVANLFDRVRLGHVTDFLDLDYWPAFNLADIFIVVGVAILFLALLLADRPPTRPRPRAPEAIRP